MAKLIVHNTREHAIHINIPAGKNREAFSTVVPSARKVGDKTINGQAIFDDGVLSEAKKHPVVGHYFKEGWLRVVGADNPARKVNPESDAQ